MLKERLVLSKKLLAEAGVIFVSIDDHEQAYLKVLMDEIFGEENFIANINWQSSFGGKNDTKLMPINTEYILLYGQHTQRLHKLKDTKPQAGYIHSDQYTSLYGRYRQAPLCRASLTYYPKLDYVIYVEQQANRLVITPQRTPNTVGEIIAGPAK